MGENNNNTNTRWISIGIYTNDRRFQFTYTRDNQECAYTVSISPISNALRRLGSYIKRVWQLVNVVNIQPY